jgi:hypothetical protein
VEGSDRRGRGAIAGGGERSQVEGSDTERKVTCWIACYIYQMRVEPLCTLDETWKKSSSKFSNLIDILRLNGMMYFFWLQAKFSYESCAAMTPASAGDSAARTVRALAVFQSVAMPRRTHANSCKALGILRSRSAFSALLLLHGSGYCCPLLSLHGMPMIV